MDVIVVHNDGAGDDVTVNAIESRKLIPTLVSDLELKGGESPALWFEANARVQPVYLLGADPKTSISPQRQTVRITDRTMTAGQIVNSGSIFIESRTASYFVAYNCTAYTAGNLEFYVEYSWDNVTFYRSLAQMTCTVVGAQYTASDQIGALPPYIRLSAERDAVAGNITIADAYLTIVT